MDERQLRIFIRKVVEEELDSFRSEISNKLKILERKLNNHVETLVEQNVNNQLVVSKQDTHMQVATYCQNNIVPAIKQLAEYVKHQTVDEQEMVSGFRKKVMGVDQRPGNQKPNEPNRALRFAFE